MLYQGKEGGEQPMYSIADTLTKEQKERFNEAWDYIDKYNLWSEYYEWFKDEYPESNVTEGLIISTITQFADMKERVSV